MTRPRASGERYGDFELIRYLTAGGMADLWLAKSTRYDGDLVIKKIQPRYVEMTRVVKMFIDEGRIAQALSHPNVVRVIDVGHHEGTYFIAMEYIPGRDLLAICRRGVEVGNFLPRHLAVAILAQATRGLVYAHEKTDETGESLRVVHCDISPGNIVVGWGGTVKLVDFGIARATIMLRAEDHSVAGKYNYMAPEQIRGDAIDARADIFAMGIILYELTVGKRLFRGRPEQVMRLVLEDPIALPTSLRPDYPPALEAIVMRALARDPDDRQQSARQLRAELLGWLNDTGEAHDKRQIAEYLRGVFGAKKQRDADEFSDGSDDEELVLEAALPAIDEPLHVDAEDPPDELVVLAAPVPLVVTPPAPAADAVQSIHEATTAPIDTDAPTGRVTRAVLAEVRPDDPLPLEEPPTVRLRADDTKKKIVLAADGAPAAQRRQPWWRRLFGWLFGKH